MQSKDLDEKTQQFVRKMPFIKAIMLTELQNDSEVFRYLAEDIEFKSKADENFLNGLRGGMNELYTDFQNQFKKLGDCNNFQIAVFYDQYFVKKVQIGSNILMIVIADTATVDLGQLDLLISEYSSNF